MPCVTDLSNDPMPGDLENVLLRKILNRLCGVSSGGGGGVSQVYVDARDAATLASANANAVAGDVATLAAAMSSASALYVLKSGDTMTGALFQPAGSVGAPALSRSGDTDTGIWYPAANTWAISTAGAERVRIGSTGLVGIGTASPTQSLEVLSTAFPQFRIAFNGAAYLTMSHGGVFNLVSGNSNAFDFQEEGISRLFIQSGSINGFVGIGTILPLAKLHVTPAASGTDYFRIDHSDGTPRFQAGALTGATTYGALWLGNITPDATNYGLANDGATTFLNADTGGVINFSIAGVSILNVSSSGLLFAPDNTYDIGAAGATRPKNYFGAGTVNAAAGLITGNVASLVTSSAAMNNGAAAALGTLTDAPVAGNPTKWIPIDDNGTIRYIPAW